MRCDVLALSLLMACKPDDSPTPADSGVPWTEGDEDADGYTTLDDCNDNDALVFPGAAERCNGIDDNCDAQVDEGLFTTWFRDEDGDGYGREGSDAQACTPPEGYASVGGDCADDDSSVSPGASEICDGYGGDEDCDGLVNEDDDSLSDGKTWFTDADGDGYGDPATEEISCGTIDGLVSKGTDCNDDDPAISPQAQEVCDGADVDEDCDGGADELDPEGPTDQVPQYIDADGDGFGSDAEPPAFFCDGIPSGYAPNDDDCDDGDSTMHPFNVEDCDDGKDNDCDTQVDDCGPLPPVTGADADASFIGTASRTWFGVAADSEGDLDGDGQPDVVVGAMYDHSNYGAVYVMDAATGGSASDASADITGSVSGGYLGQWVHAAGDLDGDGMNDVAVGRYAWPNAAVFYGPIIGDLTEDMGDLQLSGSTVDDFPSGVDGHLDYNDDGVPDLMAGAFYADFASSASNEGAVYLFAGPLGSSLAAADADVTLKGPTTAAALGQYVASLGDVTGDGIDDIAAGAPTDSTGASAAGSMHVLFGGDDLSGTLSTADAVYRTSVANDYVARLAGRFDQNGDGYNDFAIGAHGHKVSGATTGGVYVVDGPLSSGSQVLPTAAEATLEGSSTNGAFGYAIEGEDGNGDGFGDLVVSAVYANSSKGAAYLFLGPVSGVVSASSARWTVNGGSYDYMGSAVAFVDDLDGDYQKEIFVTADYGSTATAGFGAGYLFKSHGL